MPEPAIGGQRLPYLQILRAVAASLVVIDHAMERLIVGGSLASASEQLGWFLGWLGVAVFFVISGLIMALTTSREFGQPGAAIRFLRRRSIRVIPLYWLATLVYAALRIASGAPVTVSEFIRSLLFIPYRVGQAPVMRPIVGQGWTLNFEMFFYLVFALGLFLPRWLGLSLLLLGLPVLVGLGFLDHPPTPYLDPITPLQFWTDPWMLLFVLGVLAGLGELRAANRREAGRQPGRDAKKAVSVFRTLSHKALAGSLALLMAAVAGFMGADLRLPLALPWQAVFGIVCALCVILCSQASPPRETPGIRLLARAGDSSYSMYLFHPLLLAGLMAVAGRMPAILLRSPALFVVVAVLLCNFGGYAIYALVERPLGGIMRRLAGPQAHPKGLVGTAP